jgi:hypothetical protein
VSQGESEVGESIGVSLSQLVIQSESIGVNMSQVSGYATTP